jgi:hypothetical protein
VRKNVNVRGEGTDGAGSAREIVGVVLSFPSTTGSQGFTGSCQAFLAGRTGQVFATGPGPTLRGNQPTAGTPKEDT